MHVLILPKLLQAFVLFYFSPWRIALPVYTIAAVGSVFIHRKALLPLQQRPLVGKRPMIGDRAVVMRVKEGEAEVDYQRKIRHAVSLQFLKPRQQVIIEAAEELTLQVVPVAQ
jgi:membrane protein implicated in regulation of membrane protease activity